MAKLVLGQPNGGAIRRDMRVCRRLENIAHGVGDTLHLLQNTGFAVAFGGEFHSDVEEPPGIHNKIWCIHNAALPQVVAMVCTMPPKAGPRLVLWIEMMALSPL
jgi:hypothetical protein